MPSIARPSTTGAVPYLALLLLASTLGCQLQELVAPPPPAKISVTPPSLDDSSFVGSPDGVPRTLAVQPEGVDRVSWKASTAVNSAWLSLRTTSADAPGTINLMLQPGSLSEGSYTDTVVVTPTGSEDRPVKIPVTFTVRSAPIRLAFSTQPATTKAGSAITPAVVVVARDPAGRTVTSWTGSVTVSIANNPAAGVLSGTLTTTAVAGVARFANLSIDKVGSGYTLRAASATAASTTSASFNVTPKGGAGSSSSISASAGSINASNGNSTTTITVTARDEAGAAVPGALVVVTATGNANNLAPTSGTTNAQGVFVAMLSSSRAEAKTVSATVDNIPLGQNATVTVNPGPAATLAFGIQPTDTPVNGIITPALTVIVRDAFGNTASSFTENVKMDIGGNLLAGGKLNGSRDIRAVGGVATFSNLSVSRVGLGYALVASAPGGLGNVTSQTFNVTAF